MQLPCPNPDDNDEARIASFVRAHQAFVWRYLRFLGCDPATADDLTQDAFVAAIRASGARIEPRAARQYLRRVAKSLMIRQRRRRRHAPVAGASYDMVLAEQAFDEFVAHRDGDGFLDALRACLAALEPRSRLALSRRYGEGARREAIAGELGLGIEGVKSLLARSLARLRVCVQRRLA